MLQQISIDVATIIFACLTVNIAWNMVFMLRRELFIPKVERRIYLFSMLQLYIFDVGNILF